MTLRGNIPGYETWFSFCQRWGKKNSTKAKRKLIAAGAVSVVGDMTFVKMGTEWPGKKTTNNGGVG